MVEDFNAWLKKIIDFFQFNPSKKVISKILENSSFRVDNEDVYSHKRQVSPGDHRRKLKKETIDILNSQYKDILNALDYPLNENR